MSAAASAEDSRLLASVGIKCDDRWLQKARGYLAQTGGGTGDSRLSTLYRIFVESDLKLAGGKSLPADILQWNGRVRIMLP